MTEKIILDCDPGHDDAAAIMLAIASPNEIELLGITAVAGNVPVDRTALNAQKILALCDRPDIPVFKGCPRPMMGSLITGENVHGESGLDTHTEFKLPEPRGALESTHAVNAIIETLRSGEPNTITIVATGPLTNLGMALVMSPEIAERIQRIVVMGGSTWGPGNRTPAAEFNILVDPNAADIVFSCGADVIMFGLDVCRQIVITTKWIESLRAIGTQPAIGLADLMSFFNDYDVRTYGRPGAPLHDPCTIGYVIDPTLFEGQKLNVRVETSPGICYGSTVADWNGVTGGMENVTVIAEGDSERFFNLLASRIAQI